MSIIRIADLPAFNFKTTLCAPTGQIKDVSLSNEKILLFFPSFLYLLLALQMIAAKRNTGFLQQFREGWQSCKAAKLLKQGYLRAGSWRPPAAYINEKSCPGGQLSSLLQAQKEAYDMSILRIANLPAFNFKTTLCVTITQFKNSPFSRKTRAADNKQLLDIVCRRQRTRRLINKMWLWVTEQVLFEQRENPFSP